MKTMNKKIYVKPQMEELKGVELSLLAESGAQATEGFARQQDMSDFDFDEEKE